MYFWQITSNSSYSTLVKAYKSWLREDTRSRIYEIVIRSSKETGLTKKLSKKFLPFRIQQPSA